MTKALAGKVALVTGASSGIGRGAAIALAEAGARVALVARRADRLIALREKIEQAGGEAFDIALDVSDEVEAEQAVKAAVDHFGRLDIVVNAAGMMGPGSVSDAVLEEWREVFAVNFWATLYVSKAAVPFLKLQGAGDIVNISSTAGRRPGAATLGPYATSKHAVNTLSEGLRQEVGLAGIRVSVIEPGATETEVFESIKDEQLREGIRSHVTKEGAMQPEDIAATIIFIVTLPPRASVSLILVRPTIDVGPS
jgi:NADP-dependent 3-hydroxy acid dehydrogenase YdfG